MNGLPTVSVQIFSNGARTRKASPNSQPSVFFLALESCLFSSPKFTDLSSVARASNIISVFSLTKKINAMHWSCNGHKGTVLALVNILH